MRKLGSYLLILIFLTAYGRCVADQFGMLHTSETACCAIACDAVDHCGDTQDKQPENQDNQDDPAPCQLCFILNSDSMLLDDGIEIPAPTFSEITPLSSLHNSLENLFGGQPPSFSPGLPSSDHPDPPAEQRSRLQRIVAKTTPVRGPSIA